MRHHRPRPLIAAAGLAAFLILSPATAQQVDYVGTHVWQESDEDFGGFSGIEITGAGRGYYALSDRGTIRWGEVSRDAQGRIRAMTQAGVTRLRDSKGQPLPPGWLGDAEGLAVDEAGRIWVSFEGLHRIARYDDPDRPAHRIESPEAFKALQPNAGLEALAIAPDGAIIGVVERSGSRSQPFPVWRWQNGVWDQPFSIPRDGNWLPTGADFGPDGRFYLLERDFQGLRGFASRIRRFDWGEGGPMAPQTLLETTPGQYDNLEGISVWDDGQGLRITMISDDNFLFLQRTELVEYRVTDPAPARGD